MRFKLRDNASHNVKKTLDLRRGGLSPVLWVNIAESYVAKRADIWLNFRIRHFGRLMNQEYFARFQYSPNLLGDEVRIELAGGDPQPPNGYVEKPDAGISTEQAKINLACTVADLLG